MPSRVIHLTALANEMISCRIFISRQSAEGRHILFFNGSLDYIRRQCLILCGSYKAFGLFLQIPLLQPIPWPLSLDLFCLTQYPAMEGLAFHFLIFSKVSSFSSSVCGVPHFLFYLFKFYCFFAVVPWCFERNRPTPSLHREHTPPGHSIYSPQKVVESSIVQHQLFFYFYPWLLVQLYFSLLLQLHARQVTEPMNLLQV